ncbi:hypothetical protein [Kitasatospora arboriphila]|uniref:hypothetical protein n=1 Tax=Kitasatospora arboriphila TaxID=258052 RepID=UPI0031D616C7
MLLAVLAAVANGLASVLGALVSCKKVRSGLPLVLAAASAAVVCTAVLVLTRSPLLADDAEGADETDRAERVEQPARRPGARGRCTASTPGLP